MCKRPDVSDLFPSLRGFVSRGIPCSIVDQASCGAELVRGGI